MTTVATTVVVVHAVPLASSEKDDSKYWEEQARVRATLITKDTFKHAREKKSGLASLPAPFVVSTSLNVNNRGRSNSQTRATSTRSARSGFNAAQLSSAKEIIVEGIRVPDDESDRVTHRNGRFINNVFVPNGAVPPPETTVIAGIGNSRTPKVLDSTFEEKPQLVLKPSRRARKAKSYNRQWSAIPKESQRREGLAYGGGSLSYGGYDFEGAGAGDDLYETRKPLPIESRQDEFDSFGTSGESRDYSYHAGQTKAGRPVYYIVEDSVEDLHSDRSPYHFEPADSHTSFSSAVSDYTQAGTAQTSGGQVGGLAGLLGGAGSSSADSSDFVIKEHTYTMCPGCPSFSIPIPIPKSNLKKKANTLTKGAGPAGYPAYDGGKVDYQSTTNKTFLEKIGDRVVTTWNAGFKKIIAPLKPLLGEEPLTLPKNPLAGFFGGDEGTGSEDIDDNSVDASNILEEKVSTDNNDLLDENEEKQEGGGLFDSLGNTPLLMGGLAAAGLGAFVLVENLALLATNNGDSQVIDSRSLRTNAHQYGGMTEEKQEAILKSIQKSKEKFLKGDQTEPI